MGEPTPPLLPFPIFRVSSKVDRYLLYDINTITWLRKVHHILGVLIGTLPQIPQQNVFLGLPLELMPEEARLLDDKDVAYIVDDLDWHGKGFDTTTLSQREAYKQGLAREGREAAEASNSKKQERTDLALKRLQNNDGPTRGSPHTSQDEAKVDPDDKSGTLFATSNTSNADSMVSESQSPLIVEPWTITRPTSYPPLPNPEHLLETTPPVVTTSSYALFSHLHDNGYFLSPGLRFGCQFLVYPGDPLRYHSHFLAVAADWDEEIDLLDLVGGGRLGTGVKKGWLIGGKEESSGPKQGALIRDRPNGTRENGSTESHAQEQNEIVRTFCIEWGGM